MIPYVPEEFETERLLIRAPRPEDARDVNAAVRESMAELRPWMPWADHVPTLEETEANMRTAAQAFAERTDLRLNVFLKETGVFVAGSGLHRIEWNVPLFEIGYWRRTGYEGLGLMTEAVRGITGLGFHTLGAERMEIRCDTHNERSRRVAVRLGYRLEGILRHNARTVSGELRDTAIYAMLPSEFPAA